MSRALVALLATLALLAVPSAALAATPDDAIGDLLDQGYYVEPGARTIDEDALSGLIGLARNEGSRLMVAILDEDPAGGAVTFADAILDRAGEGTVVVLTRSDDVGVASTEFSQGESEAALDRADAGGGSDLTYLAALANALLADEPVPAPATTRAASSDSGGGGGGGLIVLLVIIGALVLVVFLVVRSSKKRSEARAADELAAARAEVKAQLDAMANDILDLADRVSVAGSTEAQDHYEQASATYTEATEAFDRAEGFVDFEALFSKLDTATWQLDAAEALIEGKPLPDKPAPRETARCFYDPAHRGPFEEAELQTNAGKRTVRVCRVDADKLRRGQSPDPRMVQVGRRRVPVGAAPRSRGGGGFGGLDVFSVLVGGMASGLPHVWGGSRRGRTTSTRPSRRRSGGGFGGLPGPSRSRSRSRSTSRATSRSRTSRTRSSSSRSRTGRRRRR